MGIFDKKGMLLFPRKEKEDKSCSEDEDLIVFTDCYCQKGHELVSDFAKFKEFNGLLLNISRKEKSGQVALSPIYGCRTRVSLGIDLKEGKKYTLSCPTCETELPAYNKCHCGGKIITLFLNEEGNFDSFIGVCNRIGCENSYIQIGEELITSARLERV